MLLYLSQYQEKRWADLEKRGQKPAAFEAGVQKVMSYYNIKKLAAIFCYKTAVYFYVCGNLPNENIKNSHKNHTDDLIAACPKKKKKKNRTVIII